jgi:hypothetical protein
MERQRALLLMVAFMFAASFARLAYTHKQEPRAFPER